MARIGALIKRFPDGKWYCRRGSSSKYKWIGPYETKHVATKVRDQITGGAWGMPQASRRRSRFGDSGMTKKHFIEVAKTLSEIRSKPARAREIDRWIPMLKAQNPRFDAARFRSAVEAAATKHGNRRRSSRWGDDGPAPALAPAAAAPVAGNKRRRRGTCAVCGGSHSWKSCPHHHGDKRGRAHTKRNARTGKFTRRR